MPLMSLLEPLLWLAAIPLWIACGYLLLLTLRSTRPAIPADAKTFPRFLIAVPAHDEADGIQRTVRSLLALEWPADCRRVCVVADNCNDRTAPLAQEAGAEVLERQDAARRGKGHALELAYAQALREAWADAVVVVDADTDVDPGLLRAFAARLHAGEQAMQAYYGVRNPLVSWRTRLVTIALALFHRLRGRGRENLRLSCGLRGNGMCFALSTLAHVPHRAYSLVEDLEYGIALGRAGIRVAYVDEASVRADMVSGGAAARSQRQRWEGGRRQFARVEGLRLLREALRARSALKLDLALDVLVPPLATLGLAAALLAGVAAVAAGGGVVGVPGWLLCSAPLTMLLIYVARGVVLSGLGLRGWLDLAMAPFYLAWKLSLLAGRAPVAWIRTAREDKPRE